MYYLKRPQLLVNNLFTCNKILTTLVKEIELMSETKETDVSGSGKKILKDDSTIESKKQKIETFVRVKRKNYAMMLGYLGKNYYGMQRNPGMKTIEEDLINAMFKADLITSEAFETIQSINFQRAARTDKGVSAIRQVVSLKLPDNPCIQSINENLPDDIKVFAVKRVTKGFNSKSQCDARTYSYTMPTYAFDSENLNLFQETTLYNDVEKRMEQLSKIDGKTINEYRISDDKIQRLNEILSIYQGTHNFHNFTSKIMPLDPRAKRYIMSFIAEKPFIVNNMEFITLKVKGQSFMLHQIRKMVSLLIGVLRNIITTTVFEQAFDHQKYDIVRAPSLGLMLDFVHYDYYNKRYGADGMHETLDWVDCEAQVENFKHNRILKHIIDAEVNGKSMLEWLANLNATSYGIRDDKNVGPANDGKI